MTIAFRFSNGPNLKVKLVLPYLVHQIRFEFLSSMGLTSLQLEEVSIIV